MSPLVANAQAGKTLVAVKKSREDAGWRIDVALDQPFRVLRHAPEERGRSVRIQIQPLDLSPQIDGDISSRREALRTPRSEPGPGAEVVYEPTENTLEVRFESAVDFRVAQGADFRSVSVHIADAGSIVLPPAGAAPEADGVGSKRVAEARRAITLGELDRAVLLLDKELASPDASEAARREARELIGIVRERRGQLAHARAEYEAYLAEWPKGPGSECVRQRLESLLTARAGPNEPLRAATAGSTNNFARTDVYGSLAAVYNRWEAITDSAGGRVYDSSAIADMLLVARHESSSVVLRGEFVGSYRYDFEHGTTGDDARVSTLAVAANAPDGRWAAIVGRQSRSNGGVLGRFDGVHASLAVAPGVRLAALAGMPVETVTSNGLQTDKLVFGVSAELEQIFPGATAEIFFAGQRNYGLTDRLAIGGELRYVRPGAFALAFLDYDVHFKSLNTFLLTGNVNVRAETDLNVLFETRNAPVLTLENALIGQPVDNIGDLDDSFSDSELERLAKDRTARSYTGSIGVTQRLGRGWQIAGDLVVSHLSSTTASGGVEAYPAYGPEVGVGFQANRIDFIRPGGYGTAWIRYTVGEVVDTLSLFTSARFPAGKYLDITGRLRGTYRMGDDDIVPRDRIELRPSMRLDVRVSDFIIDAELGLEWTKGLAGAGDLDRLSYFAELVLRWDF